MGPHRIHLGLLVVVATAGGACTSILGADERYEDAGSEGPGSSGAGGGTGVSSSGSASSAESATSTSSASTGTGGTGGDSLGTCEDSFVGPEVLAFPGRLPRAGFQGDDPVLAFLDGPSARLGELDGASPPHGSNATQGALWVEGAGLVHEDGGMLFLAADPASVDTVRLGIEVDHLGPIFGVTPGGTVQLATLRADEPRFLSCLPAEKPQENCSETLWPVGCDLRPTAPGVHSFGISFPAGGVPTFHRLCQTDDVEVRRFPEDDESHRIPENIDEVAVVPLDPPALILPSRTAQAVSLQIGDVREFVATGGNKPIRPTATLAEGRLAAAWQWGGERGSEIAVMQCDVSSGLDVSSMTIDVESCACRTLDVRDASNPSLAAKGPRIVLGYEVENAGEVALIELAEFR